MPNYIKNRIELIGSDKDIATLKERFSTHIEAYQKTSFDDELTFTDGNDNYGWLNEQTNTFMRRDEKDVIGVPKGWKPLMHEAWTRFPDFNRIIPMPETLSIQVHSGIENAVKESLKMDCHKDMLIGMLEMENRKNSKSPLEFNDEEFELYLTALKNVKKYGFIYWYDWAIENWGTKWNAFECESEGNSFDFVTAWSGVPELIEKMHLEIPRVKILYEFSDENTGCNCGIGTYENGTSNFRKLENSSIEAYELAFKLRPDNKEYYALVGGKYEYVDED